jgi:hypothetical protein
MGIDTMNIIGKSIGRLGGLLAALLMPAPPALAQTSTTGATYVVGPKGDRGCSVLTASGVPAPSLGNNCDWAVDAAAGRWYGPKIGGAWPPPIVLGFAADAIAARDAAIGAYASVQQQATLASGFAATTQGYVATAQTAAANAASSAAAAVGSAASATTNAGGASASATAATTKAGEASVSATASAGSATTATTKAGEASVSAAAAASAKTMIDAAVASIGALGASPASFPASPYLLDGLPPAAVFSAPTGAFMLNGAVVPLASLLTFSSGAKYTVGADGNYVLNAANQPAWDWSTGLRRLLIEAAPTTNYWVNSENASAWTSNGGAAVSISVAPNALFGTLALATITSANGANTSHGTHIASVSAGEKISLTVALLAVGSKTSVEAGLSGSAVTWGANGDSTAAAVAGPGTLVQTGGGRWTVNNLSTSVPTVVRITRTYQEAGTAAAIIYSNFTAAGQAFKAGRPQFERGAGSSYVVAAASPTTRPADVVTLASGLASLLTGTTLMGPDVSAAMRGTLLTSEGALLGNSVNYAGLYFYSGGSQVGLFSGNGATVYALSQAGSLNFGVAFAAGAARRLSSLQGAVVSDTLPTFNSAANGLRIGVVTGYGASSNMLLDEIVVWPFTGSAAGVQSQARSFQ